MRRILLLPVLLLLLTGCSENRAMDRAIQFRQSLLAAPGCGFSVCVTADYGDWLQSFAMDCQVDEAGNVTFTLGEPESISGLQGSVNERGGVLFISDTGVHFELLTDRQLNPAAAPWILMKTLRGGYITSAGMEDELLRLSVDDSYADNALRLDVWLDARDQPVRGEILCDGRKILSLQLEDFHFL